MRVRGKISRVAVTLAAVLLAAPVAMAQQGPGGGGGGGGGEPTDVGSEYSDLVVALRDVDGLPIFAEFETAEGTSYCVQPVATEPLPGLDDTGITNPVDGTTVYPIPLMGDSPELTEDDEVCDPAPAYAMYVSEAELERLNMARTDDDVLDQKLVDVMQRLLGTDQPVTLDGAGRLVIDGVVTDAGPEHAALYQSLMLTGWIPGLDSAYSAGDGTAQIGPFGPWELAAASLGSAASKFVPVTIDAAIYYVRITDVAEPTVPWRAPALSLLGRDATYTGVDEEFVDFGEFSYTRANVFPGCATWLDVPTLTWRTGPIVELADFAPLPPIAHDGILDNVAGFAQLAADVRSAVFYLHEHEVILPGFYMDPVGQDTCEAQEAALTAPAVDFGALPEEIVQTETFTMDASLYNPLDGSALEDARLKVTIDAIDADFTDGAVVTATADAGSITFAPDANGDLVGWWGPEAGFPVPVRYNETTSFDVRVDEAAPTGMYNLTLELIVPTPDGLALATDTATINVLDDVVTARWIEFPGYVDQAVNVTATARVFNPETAEPTPEGTQLKLTVVGPEVTDPAEAMVAEDLQVYVNAVRIPMALEEDGSAVGLYALPELVSGAATEVTFYVMVADGAPQGMYEMTVEVVPAEDDTRLVGEPDTEDMYVGPAEEHGEAPDDPGNGEDTTTSTSTTLPPSEDLTDMFEGADFQAWGTYIPLVGDFDGDSPANANDILWYAPGPAADSVWDVTLTESGFSYTVTPLTINGTYQPFVYDFDDDGVDDIFWYGPGSVADSVWFGLGDMQFQSKPVTVSGTYKPVVTEAQGQTVIYWYGPGTAVDNMWAATASRTFTNVPPRQVNGYYEPVAIRGAGGEPGILWYGPGSTPDFVWDGLALGTGAPATNVAVTIGGSYKPLPAYPSALLYSPTEPERLVGFGEGQSGWTELTGELGDATIVATSYELGNLVLHRPGTAMDELFVLIVK